MQNPIGTSVVRSQARNISLEMPCEASRALDPQSPAQSECRAAFSLLEMIIATAILAASGMVLSSLIGLGARFGNRAEERTMAMEQAHSLLAQFLAQPPGKEASEELVGELPGLPVHSFRIQVDEFTATGNSSVQFGQMLRRVTVEVFAGTANASSDSNPTLCRVSQIVRAHQLAVGNGVDLASFNGEPGSVPDLPSQRGTP